MSRTRRVQAILDHYSSYVHDFVNKFSPLFLKPTMFNLPSYEDTCHLYAQKILVYLRFLLQELHDPDADAKYRLFLEKFATLQYSLRENKAEDVPNDIRWLVKHLAPILRDAEARFNITARTGKTSIVETMARASSN